MSKRTGPPKHQNSYAWKPNLGRKINETVAEAFRTFDRDSRSTEDTSQLTSSCAPWCHYKWLEGWCMLTRFL
ncbi:hypothetical protein ZWY2020_016765 [Hordeum vulgare]|nr:hypothetical protein ZWY2020_016765 [Hordeum vulgare]